MLQRFAESEVGAVFVTDCSATGYIITEASSQASRISETAELYSLTLWHSENISARWYISDASFDTGVLYHGIAVVMVG